MLSDPERTGYVAVALPEEMPVNETIELERRLRDAVGLGLDAIVMNAMWPERFSAADITKLRAAAQDGADVGAVARGAGRARAREGPARARAPARGGDRRADHRRCRSSSSPSSSSRTTSSSRPSCWNASDARRAVSRRSPGLGLARVLARLLGGGAGGRDVLPLNVEALAPWAGSRRWCVGLVVDARSCRALRCARWRWDVRDEGIDIQSGAVEVVAHAGPVGARAARRDRRGVLEQSFGLATVMVHTAAGSHTIPLLAQADAEELRERIAGPGPRRRRGRGAAHARPAVPARRWLSRAGCTGRRS